MDANSLGSSWTSTRLRPCRSFCQSVEQRCPYLLPGDRAPAYPTQYAGEPTFLCRDPNIPETGEQAARALHSSDDDECCFHVCSEDAPGSGICANCTEPWRHGRVHDPSTAPQCETNPPQAGFTGQEYPGSQAGQPEVTTDRGMVDDDQDTDGASSSTTITPASSTTVSSQQDTSFCGSGRIGSISSASSLGRSTPSVVLQLLWLCSMILISLSGNGALHNNNNLAFWSPFALFRVISSTFCLLLRARLGLDGSLRLAFFGSRAAKFAVVRSLLFVLGMPRRALVPEARSVFASVSRLVVLVAMALVAEVPGYMAAAGHVGAFAEGGSYGDSRNTTATARKKKEQREKKKKKNEQRVEEKGLLQDTRDGRVFRQVDVEEGPAIEWLASLS
ncbi:hypothetical protein EAI_12390 [Harpegnathos saltator]|uniref:Uncharacterized protein n=1 Tax=Harpegnathos saltator TaxID=610380 RepID=E2BGC1_HARSA|nr:hypothetical protein EAI_12390 [Harpegnathos saltator]